MNFATLLHLAVALPVARARKVVALVAAQAAEEQSAEEAYRHRAALAWEQDLQPVRMALLAALHADTTEAFTGLRHLLPGLLVLADQGGGLESVLGEALLYGFCTGYQAEIHKAAPLSAAEARSTGSGPSARLGAPAVTDAQRMHRARELFPTDLGSADFAGLSGEFKRRRIFSARTTNARHLQEIADAVDDELAGRTNRATSRLRLLRSLKEEGYDPAIGFPGDLANIPPAERGSLQDLGSERRLNLVLETQMRMAVGYGKALAGNGEYERREYPALELVRVYPRHTPRGERRDRDGALVEDPAHGWPRRWEIAGTAVDFEGALRGQMIARKDSPIWEALGDGRGSTFTDCLGNEYEPYAIGSGMGRKAVARAAWEAVQGSDTGTPAPVKTSLAPTKEQAAQAYKNLAADLKAALARELAELEAML